MGDRSANQFGGVGGIDAFLGKGTKVTGHIVLQGTARIEGQVDGEITAQDTLTIGEAATLNAKVSGTTIIVEGQITGDVTARQRLELRTSARVKGDVSAASLVVHEGAILNGQCSMTGVDTKTQSQTDTSTDTLAATLNLDRARDTSVQIASALTTR